jgi:hypothetical protein
VKRFISAFWLFCFLFSSQTFAAAEYGVGFGPFLPFRIAGVREVLNGWGGHAGVQTSKGFFEVDYFSAHGDGIDYHTVGFDYRLDVANKEILPEMLVHFVLGFNADYFKPATTMDYRQSGGWHYGGGVRIPLGGTTSPFLLRADFKQRFGPGNSLIVQVGFIFVTGSDGPEKP